MSKGRAVGRAALQHAASLKYIATGEDNPLGRENDGRELHYLLMFRCYPYICWMTWSNLIQATIYIIHYKLYCILNKVAALLVYAPKACCPFSFLFIFPNISRHGQQRQYTACWHIIEMLLYEAEACPACMSEIEMGLSTHININ